MLDLARKRKSSECDKCCYIAADLARLRGEKERLLTEVTEQMIACELVAGHSTQVISDIRKGIQARNQRISAQLAKRSTTLS